MTAAQAQFRTDLAETASPGPWSQVRRPPFAASREVVRTARARAQAVAVASPVALVIARPAT